MAVWRFAPHAATTAIPCHTPHLADAVQEHFTNGVASAMSPPIGPKLTFISAEETIVELEFSPDAAASDSYDLCYKVYQQTWEQQRVKAIGKDLLKGASVQVAIEELEPGTTYCFRLLAKSLDGSTGEPGPELIIDTEAISCTPKRRRCIIM